MEIEVEKINETHLPLLNSWASYFGLPAMPSEFLPEYGFLISISKVKVLAGFLYCTDSEIVFIENIISNPDANKDQKRSAIEKLLDTCALYAKEMLYSAIYIRSSLPSLISKLKDAEFNEVANNCSLMIRRI